MKKGKKKITLLLVAALLLQVCPGFSAGQGEVQAADDKMIVACVGDSMTYGYTSQNPATQSYPARLQVMLGDQYEVKNFGVNSKTMISDVADSYIKTDAYQQSISCNPDIVILMLGSNDVKAKYWDAQKYASDAKKLMETYKNLPSSPRVIYATTPASARFSNDDIRMQTIDEELVPLQRQLAEENQWELIDIYEKSHGRYPLYNADGIHFTAQGYYYEAECMYEGIMGKPLAEKSLPLRSISSPTQETGTEVECAIDDDYATLWHSQYTPSASPREQHYAVIELEKRSLVDGLEYLPRLDNGTNGIITGYEIEISNDGGKSYRKVSEGNWDETRVWKYAEFAPVEATHVKLISKTSISVNNNDLTSAVEIRLTGEAYTAATAQEARENLQSDYENEIALKRNQANYKEESWNALQKELEQVKAALEDTALSLEELNKRTEAFRQAILDLKEIPTTALDPLKAMEARYYVAKDGTLLPYRIYFPEDYDGTKEYPLLLFLHGAGERGVNNTSQLEMSVQLSFFLRVLGPEREQYPAVIVAPQCPEGQQWVDTPWANGNYKLSEVPQSNESKAVEELLDELLKEYAIDESRQYLAGFSMGAFGVWDLVMRHPERYAAAAAFAGAGDPSMAAEIKDVPIWGFHGQTDTTVPFEKSTKVMIEALRAVGGNPRYTEYTAEDTGDNGHLIRMAYYEPELLPWMFAQDTNPVDKTELKALIAELEALDTASYTEDSVLALKEALDEAKAFASVELNEQTQQQVKEYIEKLKNAKENLQEKEPEPEPEPKPEPEIQMPYTDVAKSQWYYSYVGDVYKKKLMTGLDKTTFGPDQTLVRAQFATILYRMEGQPKTSFAERFKDVPDQQFFTEPVLWAASDKVKVVTGYSNGNFGPNDQITREQMALMMYRYAKFKNMDVSEKKSLAQFPDEGQVSSYARDAMEWCVAKGIISGQGTSEKRLNPQGQTTRAECATIISRYAKLK